MVQEDLGESSMRERESTCSASMCVHIPSTGAEASQMLPAPLLASLVKKVDSSSLRDPHLKPIRWRTIDTGLPDLASPNKLKCLHQLTTPPPKKGIDVSKSLHLQ